ncbi:MAG: hypothetical protein QXS02_03780 [Candidatus Thermoplasmatota archaeon]
MKLVDHSRPLWEITWQRFHGGNQYDMGEIVIPLSRGGYLIGGYSDSTDLLGSPDGNILLNYGMLDCYLTRLDQHGEMVWTRLFGGGSYDYILSMQETSDQGVIFTGFSYSRVIPKDPYHPQQGHLVNHGMADVYIVKLDRDYKVEWSLLLGGSDLDFGRSICQTQDGGYIVVGVSFSVDIPGAVNHGGFDVYVIRIAADGSLLWQTLLGGDCNDLANDIQETRDMYGQPDGYIIVGKSNSTNLRTPEQRSYLTHHGYYDALIMKLDTHGVVEWQRLYGGSRPEELFCVYQTSDNGYIAGGRSQSIDLPGAPHHGIGCEDGYIMKLSSSGNLQWHQQFGGTDSDGFYGMCPLSTGYIVAAGYTTSSDIIGAPPLHGSTDIYLLVITQNGSLCTQILLGGRKVDIATSVKETLDRGIIVSGVSNSDDLGGYHGGNADMYIIKLDPVDHPYGTM